MMSEESNDGGFKEGQQVRYVSQGRSVSSYWEQGDVLTLGKFNLDGDNMWEVTGYVAPQWVSPEFLAEIQ